MNKTILSFALLLITSYLVAQKTSGIPLAKQVTLHSEIVGDDYSLQVTLPYPFKPYEKKYPVLFYLDAFGKSAGMNELVKSKMYSRSFQQFVMVGISYNTNLRAYGKLRSRDYIPPMNDMDSINGGSNFLNFIKDELIPYCEPTIVQIQMIEDCWGILLVVYLLLGHSKKNLIYLINWQF
jgi:predicted alpha/beta superfamily hydrolase